MHCALSGDYHNFSLTSFQFNSSRVTSLANYFKNIESLRKYNLRYETAIENVIYLLDNTLFLELAMFLADAQLVVGKYEGDN